MDKRELIHAIRERGHFFYYRRGQRPAQIRALHFIGREGTISQKDLMNSYRSMAVITGFT